MLKPTDLLPKRTAGRRGKEISNAFKNATSQNPDIKKAAIADLCRDIYTMIKEHINDRMEPLEEHEIVDIISNANLSENQFHSIIRRLRSKWHGIINQDLRRTLALRKRACVESYI